MTNGCILETVSISDMSRPEKQKTKYDNDNLSGTDYVLHLMF